MESYEDRLMRQCEWINLEFIQEILGKNNNILVDSIAIKPAVGAGDNYLSLLYRVKLTIRKSPESQTKVISLIIKAVPDSEAALQQVKAMDLFRKEIKIYEEILPMMKTIYEKYFKDEQEFIAPKFYKCLREETLVMEDLVHREFKMVERRLQCDWMHCFYALKVLATFHALSLKLHNENPSLIELADSDMYVEWNRDSLSQFLEFACQNLASVIETWGEKYIRAANIYRATSAQAFDRMLQTRVEGQWNVLLHGDSWVNNILFKYDNKNEVLCAKLIDFQLCRFASPAIDILYFLFTSSQPDVIRTKFPQLIQAYHFCLSSELEMLGEDPEQYTDEQLQQDIQDRIYSAFINIAMILPLVVAKPQDAFNLEDLKKLDENETFPILKNYEDPRYQEIASVYLDTLEEFDYFDVIERSLEIN